MQLSRADGRSIDPKRENPKLSRTFQQKLFDHGVNSKLLCRTLLQAKVLYREEFQTIDVAEAKRLSFDAFGSLIAMDDEAKEFAKIVDAAVQRSNAAKQNSSSLVVPAASNVRNHAKTFIQKADHFSHALLKIMRLFYPEATNWTKFEELVKQAYSDSDNFCKLAMELTPILRLIRDARDALEHNPDNIVVKDFEPQANGKIWVPSLSLTHRKSRQERISLAAFMSECTETLSIAFEMLNVHACAKATKPFAGMTMVIGVLPDDIRSAWHVRFAYGAYYEDGKFVPCG